jgi:hypothetical protein
MGEQISDYQYVEELLTDFDLRPSDKISDLLQALDEEEED